MDFSPGITRQEVRRIVVQDEQLGLETKKHHPVGTRARRRNVFRALGILPQWRPLTPWAFANTRAKLGERRAQCEQANREVAKALASEQYASGGGRKAKIVRGALLKFWNGQQRTRVVGRILKELA